ncbi:MAG: cobalamin B12-binding domain-containing protein [Pseudomonadota bacterium]
MTSPDATPGTDAARGDGLSADRDADFGLVERRAARETLDRVADGGDLAPFGAAGMAGLVQFASTLTSRCNSPKQSEMAQKLRETIEGELVPRLMIAHKQGGGAPAPHREPDDGSRMLTPDDHERFLRTVLDGTPDDVRLFIEALAGDGVNLDDLLIDLLPQTARALGAMWEADEKDFTDVTIGLCRLHQVLRERSPAFHPGRRQAGAGRILLGSFSADEHALGLAIVAEFFRRAHWRVTSRPGAACRELSALAGAESFDVIGLSGAQARHADAYAAEIAALRAASCNADVKVLVGGKAFLDDPDLAARCGADAFAEDAQRAPSIADILLAQSAVHC